LEIVGTVAGVVEVGLGSIPFGGIMSDQKKSKFLSYVLRHAPQSIGLTLDTNGWAEVPELLSKSVGIAPGGKLDMPTLERIVSEDQKQRYAFNEDKSKIRASQGHSVEVDLGLKPKFPPPILYHGTATRFVDSIKAEGLKPQSRQQVHLSQDVKTATSVGQRHGEPVILTIMAGAMAGEGHEFFVSDNGVWLTDHVPSRFISF
jgi:putative RNA 2'-phosphotransferase